MADNSDHKQQTPNWGLVSREDIANSPSRPHLSADEERKQRYRMSRCVLQAGQLLKLPIVTISTAIIYFHRVYSRVSLAKHDPTNTARACLFLAAKAEETERRMRDIINVVYRVMHPSEPPLQVGKQYWKISAESLRCEQLVLRVLGWDLEVSHSHSFLLHMVRELEGTEELATVSLCILNDSLCTTLCLEYEPAFIACAAIHLAGELVSDQISATVGVEWWENFGVHRVQIEDICHQIMAVYDLDAAVSDRDATSSMISQS